MAPKIVPRSAESLRCTGIAELGDAKGIVVGDAERIVVGDAEGIVVGDAEGLGVVEFRHVDVFPAATCNNPS
jgi:hypothetical protein